MCQSYPLCEKHSRIEPECLQNAINLGILRQTTRQLAEIKGEPHETGERGSLGKAACLVELLGFGLEDIKRIGVLYDGFRLRLLGFLV